MKSFDAKNLKSANSHPEIVREKIDKEVQAGRVEGPFDRPPFLQFRVSPLGLVPKKEPGEFRLIHHLSYPQGDSVNDHIDPDLCSVQYTKFDAAVQMIQRLGKGALLAKSDIKSAFRLIPIAKEEFYLLGFQFDGLFYFDKALPFGCSISCATFELFASFLEWAVRQRCSVGELLHYLDDFLFGGRKDSNQCSLMMNSFQSCCDQMGVPVAVEKTEGPSTVIVFLGLELDSILMQIRIPMEKLAALVSAIRDILSHKRTVRLRELQSLIGSLNFVCRAVVPGRPFCRRLIDATCGVPSKHHHITVNRGMRLDLQMWLTFFQDFNGISVFHESVWHSNADVCLFTDSSAANGFGAYFQGQWVCESWPISWTEQGRTANITLLEYFPILVAVCIWGEQMRNKKVKFSCDNKPVVEIINRQTSKSPEIMVLVRAFTLKCLQLNLVFRAEHISGADNGIADSLSRFQMDRFRDLAPNAAATPMQVPAHLWRIFDSELGNF